MLKKLTKITIAGVLAASSTIAPISTVFAQTKNSGEVVTSLTQNKVTIGNNAIAREFDLTNNKLKTTKIDNKLAGNDFVPGDKSEEFIINLLKDNSNVTFNKPREGQLTSVKPSQESTSAVTVKVSSTYTEETGVHANNIIDGRANTHWASAESASQAKGSQWVEIDFGSVQSVKSVNYTPRWNDQQKYNCTGRVNEYKLEAWDGSKFVEKTRGTFTVDGDTTKEHGTSTITLDQPVETSKIRLVALETYFWDGSLSGKVMNVAELDVFDENHTSLVHSQPSEPWTIEGSSVQRGDGSGYGALIDGVASTYYHSRYSENGEGTDRKLPITLTIDRKNNTPFQTFGYLPRPGDKVANGDFLEYEVYVSNDKESLYQAANKKLESKFIYNDNVFEGGHPQFMYASFDEKQTGRYVGVKVLKGYGGNFAAGAEIDLFAEKFDTYAKNDLYPDTQVKASDLTLASAPVIENTIATINKERKEGVMVTFNFEPFNGIQVAQKVVMYDGDHFMRKFLEIKFDDKTQRIDYIDGEHLQVSSSDNYWTIPHAGGVVQMDEFKANLGQPIYINGMFLGSEFPASQTEVLNKTGFIRYYTGKNFNDFERDGQLTKDGKYVSWQTVVGASPAKTSEGNNLDIVKQSFFNYIDSIATPSEFRIQYNSWFDNMMRITDENILSSFSAVDKHLSETGVRPLDSYVVDDGWNIYRKTPGSLSDRDGIERNGPVNEINTTGFWQFNSKFPHGLTPSSELVQNFGSNFGVWVGPRGGYNYQGTLADIIQTGVDIDGVHHQYGSSAGGSIDVADQRYVDKFKEMAIEWVTDYKVNYWKWDGFADTGQYNAFPSGEGVVGYDENHHHMYGGPHHMYHVTDLWEKWIVLMSDVRDAAEKVGINNLWISLTCYVNPSPWYLQWANSVWIQCVADRGERTNSNGALSNKMDAMLTYRDGAYYDFTVTHNFQFPLANLYNHDPIYGKEGTGINKNSMNGEQFRNYMFMQGTRGTAFWELYYSDSIFNEEKYLINADFLEWEEANFDMIRNAIMIGGTPSSTAKLTGGVYGDAGQQEAYGFAGFNATGNEGIISMRNPAATEKTITFTLDATIGAKTPVGTTYNVTKDHAFTTNGEQGAAQIANTYTQGQEISITLKPGETYVLHLNTVKDTTAPVINKLYIKDANTVQVQTSKHISGAEFAITVNGKRVNYTAKPYADLRTFDLTLDTTLTNGQEVVVSAKDGLDNANNRLEGSANLNYYKDGLTTVKEKVNGDTAISTTKDSIGGKNGFTVSLEIATEATNQVLLSQGNEYKLGIDETGHAYFELREARATSKQVVNTGETFVLTGVKENNGIVKLYVDGKVDSSNYQKSNKDYSITKDSIVVNANGSKITNVKVYNKALGYDEVPTLALAEYIAKIESERNNFTAESWSNANLDTLLANAKEIVANGDKDAMQGAQDALYAGYKQLVPTEINLALNKDITASWLETNSNPVTNSGSPLSNAVDGKFNDTSKYAIVGKDGVSTPSYIQVDLGAEYDLDRVHLYRYWQDSRTYDATAFVVSNDENFATKEVLYYSGTGDKFNLGQEATAPLYSESNQGKELYKGRSVTARYVRLYVSGRKQSSPSENHIVELQVFGKQSDPYKLAELESLIEEANVLAQDSNYNEASLEALNTQIANAQKVVAAVKAGTQEDKTMGYVLNAKDALETAIANLEVKKEDVTIAGLSVSLADYIGVNYYLSISQKVLADQGAKVVFSSEGNSVIEYTMEEILRNAIEEADGSTTYCLTVPMAARQMTDIINGKVVLSNGDEIQLKDMSVQKYAQIVLNAKEGTYSPEAIAAVKAMLNYGTRAQIYFNNKTNDLANAILDEPERIVETPENVFADYVPSKTGSVTGLDYYGTSVLLRSKTGISHYFTLAEGENIEDYTFTVNERKLKPEYREGKYYVDINDIYAKKLATTYVLTVTKGSETMTVTFGVFEYANLVVNGNYSEELKEVVRSMYPYYQAAAAYAKTVER